MAKQRTGVITIPNLKLASMTVRVEGISPLICHQFPSKTKKILLDKAQKKNVKMREAKDPEAEFNAARYRIDTEGKYVAEPNGDALPDAIPTRYIKDAMVNAARFVEGLSMVETKQLAFVELGKDGVPIQVRNGKKWKTYGIDVEPEMHESVQRVGGKGPGTGAPDIRFRPIYDQWSTEFDVTYNESLIGPEQIIALLNYGGFHAGICEHRPSKGGQNGMFKVVGA
jgi:hypothetical protein